MQTTLLHHAVVGGDDLITGPENRKQSTQRLLIKHRFTARGRVPVGVVQDIKEAASPIGQKQIEDVCALILLSFPANHLRENVRAAAVDLQLHGTDFPIELAGLLSLFADRTVALFELSQESRRVAGQIGLVGSDALQAVRVDPGFRRVDDRVQIKRDNSAGPHQPFPIDLNGRQPDHILSIVEKTPDGNAQTTNPMKRQETDRSVGHAGSVVIDDCDENIFSRLVDRGGKPR